MPINKLQSINKLHRPTGKANCEDKLLDKLHYAAAEAGLKLMAPPRTLSELIKDRPGSVKHNVCAPAPQRFQLALWPAEWDSLLGHVDDRILLLQYRWRPRWL